MDQRGAVGAEFAPVDRGFAGYLPAGGFDDAPVHTQIFQIQPDEVVVELQAQLLELEEDAGVDRLVPAGPQGGRRAGRVGDLGVGGTEDEDLDELVEDNPVRNPWPVTTPRVGHLTNRDQRGKLVPEKGDDG